MIWEFAGEPIPPRIIEEVRLFRSALVNAGSSLQIQLTKLLSQKEIKAMLNRTEQLLAVGMLATTDPELRTRLRAFREAQTQASLESELP